MASTYTRAGSPWIHVRFKDEDGKWLGKPTGFRKDNLGDARQAKLLARKFTEEDRIRHPAEKSEHWEHWVERWLAGQHNDPKKTTLTVYMRHWRKLFAWLTENRIFSPSQFTYRHAMEYREKRLDGEASPNTIIGELKLMGLVMGEAVRRGFCQGNPCVRMGLKKDKAKEKIPWTDAQIAKVAKAVPKQANFIHVTFLLGLYQAARLRQCAVPLRDIDLDHARITYRKTKGDKPFTQPIDARLLPHLTKIIADREAAGFDTLCDIPLLPSVEWRRFLDSLGLHELVHHGLRVTWITRAALSRGAVSQPEAKRFVNHGSTAVHELYQKLNAEDLAHVPAAMNLPSLTVERLGPRSKRDNAERSSS